MREPRPLGASPLLPRAPRSTGCVPAGARALLALAALLGACQTGPSAKAPAASSEPAAPAAPAPPTTLEPGQTLSLFDGTALGEWRIEELGALKNVRVEDGAIQLDWGNPGTAIRWGGATPAVGYELAFELERRAASGEGYCFVSFPVGGQRCTLVLGGWVGVQCRAPGPEAAEQGALKSTVLEAERWYAVRLRVIPTRIQASLDGAPLIDLPLAATAAP